MFDPTLVRFGDWTMASGHAAASEFLALPQRPTALFSMNDEMAIGAIQATTAVGLRVPHDMAITGFDDISFAAHSTPSLTTIAQPAEAMGAKACEILIDRIEGKSADDTVHVLPHELIVRQSSMPTI